MEGKRSPSNTKKLAEDLKKDTFWRVKKER